MKLRALVLTISLLSFLCGSTSAQHLWWNLEGQKDATCLYGEITVLVTHPSIYYCGANWHPGEAAGGYCGIQHNSPSERRTIFSIWDTSPSLHPQVTEAHAQTKFGRFGGEGEGGHTHMIWHWREGDTFQFFVQKQPGADSDTTDTRYYIYDPVAKKWLHSATITSPNGGKTSVATIGGGINSFLENYTGKDKPMPRIALYRLWLGNTPSSMKYLTQSGGDGTWGQLHHSYFLAYGDKDKLDAAFAKLEKDYGKPIFGSKDKKLTPILHKPVPPEVLTALKDLPRSPKAKDKS